MTYEFDRGIAVSPLADGRYSADLDGGWVVGGGVNGGYLLAVIGNAVRDVLDASGQVDPFSVSAHYLSASVPGPAIVDSAFGCCRAVFDGTPGSSSGGAASVGTAVALGVLLFAAAGSSSPPPQPARASVATVVTTATGSASSRRRSNTCVPPRVDSTADRT